jgi:DNA-binding NarL/FixJ family response regulator
VPDRAKVDVVRLVADGLTNQQIARRLVSKTRTHQDLLADAIR